MPHASLISLFYSRALPRLSLAACCLSLLAGCASTGPKPAPDNWVAPAFLPPPAGALIVLLPPETTARDLIPGQKMLTEQVHQQLKAMGYRTAILEKANHEKLWRQEIAAVGGIFDPATGARRNQAYARATSSLARTICAEAKCALVIQHQLVLRRAELMGRNAQWDGQSRPIPVERGGFDARFSGSVHGLSAAITGTTREGASAFRTFGGATLPTRMDLDDVKQRVRTDLFENDREIADGVRLALEPLGKP